MCFYIRWITESINVTYYSASELLTSRLLQRMSVLAYVFIKQKYFHFFVVTVKCGLLFWCSREVWPSVWCYCEVCASILVWLWSVDFYFGVTVKCVLLFWCYCEVCPSILVLLWSVAFYFGVTVKCYPLFWCYCEVLPSILVLLWSVAICLVLLWSVSTCLVLLWSVSFPFGVTVKCCLLFWCYCEVWPSVWCYCEVCNSILRILRKTACFLLT